MELTSTQAEEIAQVMGGLASPARVRILASLLDGPATVTELTEHLQLGQTAVSNNLRILRHLNLAVGQRNGKNVIYSLPDQHVRTMVQQILEHVEHG